MHALPPPHCRIDQDNNLSIEWDEWRDFFDLYPGESLEDLVQFWRASIVSIQKAIVCNAACMAVAHVIHVPTLLSSIWKSVLLVSF